MPAERVAAVGAAGQGGWTDAIPQMAITCGMADLLSAKTIWLLWPAWVWFSVMATGNHFWLDVVAGVVVAVIAGIFVYRNPFHRLRRARATTA